MTVSSSGNSRKLDLLEPLQISQINFETISIKGIIKPSELLTPLVSAELETNVNGSVLNIRMTIFIPTTLLGKTPIELYQDLESEQNELKLVLKYTSAETDPKEYHAWYVSYTHIMNEGEQEIKSIRTSTENIFLENSNPKTSRGTVTHVLQS